MRMTCWIVMMAAVMAGSAHAAAIDALPPSIVSALEDVAAAVEQPAADPAAADAQIAEAVRRLARAVPTLGAEHFPEYVQAKAVVLVPMIAQRAREGRLGEDALVDALEDLRRATEEQAAVVLRGADGPDNDCLTDVIGCFAYCTALPTAWQRTACAIGCEIDFAVCLKVLLPGGGPRQPGGGGLSVVDR